MKNGEMPNARSFEQWFAGVRPDVLSEVGSRYLLAALLFFILGFPRAEGAQAQEEAGFACPEYLLPEKLNQDFEGLVNSDLVKVLADRGCQLQALVQEAITTDGAVDIAAIIEAQRRYLEAYDQTREITGWPQIYEVPSEAIISEVIAAIKQAKDVPVLGRRTEEDLLNETTCEVNVEVGGSDECQSPTLITIRDANGQELYQVRVTNTNSVEGMPKVHSVEVFIGDISVVFLTPGFVSSENLDEQIAAGSFVGAQRRGRYSVAGSLLVNTRWAS